MRIPSRILVIGSTLLVTGLFLYASGIPYHAYEDISFALSPSAERAYEYGNVHFSAKDPREYDLQRAGMWFEKSLEFNPILKGVHHQLARVAFLSGNFPKAIRYIDTEINLPGGPVTPSSYYVRGLIEGYMGKYAAAAKDYDHYLGSDPHNWAALNDYAWVLLKAERFQDAVDVTARGLTDFPNNPWLLNSRATALYELKRYPEALETAKKAAALVQGLTETQWLVAYPGNDPGVAAEGIAAFRKAVMGNVHIISTKVASSTIQ